MDFVPVSTNDAYVPSSVRTKTGKHRHFLRKSEALQKWQESIKGAFKSEFFYKSSYLQEVASYIEGMNRGWNLKLQISMPYSQYYKKDGDLAKKGDTSNFIKTIEDSILSGIGVDDKRDISLDVEKGFNEDGVWYIYAKLTERSIHNRIDVDIENAYINKEVD